MAIRWDEVEGANFGPYLYSIENEAERLEVLYRECHDEIRKWCGQVLARAGNVCDADDAAQEALLKAASSVRKSYEPKKPFRPWLRQIARNVCADFGRAQSRTDRMRLRYVECGYGVGARTPAPEIDTPEEAVIRRILNEAIVESLLALPEAERNVLCRQVYEGLTYEEISVLEGRSHPAARSLLHRAKAKVKRQFASLGGVEEWGLPGVVGSGAAALRRFRARSRMWIVRNAPRGSNLFADSAPLNMALVARATEVVAAGMVAVAALALPHGGALASPAVAPVTATPAAVMHTTAPAHDGDTPAAQGAVASPPARVNPAAAPKERVTEVKIASPDGSGPAHTAKIERNERSITIDRKLSGPLPVFGEDYYPGGSTRYSCSKTSGQLVCGAYDQLPPGP